MNSKDVLNDAFGRLPALVEAAVKGLTPEQLRWAPAEGANTIAWLVWHLTRIQDHHVTGLIGGEQIYLTGDWAQKFGRKPDAEDHGYGHNDADVASVRPESWHTLADYYAAVHARTIDYLAGLTDKDLDRVVDEAWDPPVTAGVRLVSVVNDDAQHVGQAAYLRGLI